MPRVVHDWKVTQDDHQRSATLHDDRFVIGDDSCTLENLLEGELDNVIREYFGPGVLDEMRFLARVELTWRERPRQCRCQLFGEGSRTDPEMVQRLGLVEAITTTSIAGGFTAACQCRDCGRRWRIAIDPNYHWTLYDWSEIRGDG